MNRLNTLNTYDDKPLEGDDSLVALADEIVLGLNLDDPADFATAMKIIKTTGLSPRILKAVQPKLRECGNAYLINVGA